MYKKAISTILAIAVAASVLTFGGLIITALTAGADPVPTGAVIDVPNYVYASDMEWKTDTTGWSGHPTQRDKSIDGNALTLRLSASDLNHSFSKGIGAHAPSTTTIDIEGMGFLRFQCYAGIDREVGTNSSCYFQVLLDGAIAYAATRAQYDTDALVIDLDVVGKKEISLVTQQYGSSNSSQHSDWADAKFVAELTAQKVADALVIPPIEKGQAALELPELPAGFSVELTASSNTAVIGAGGNIAPPFVDTDVDLTFTVFKDGESGGVTKVIRVVVPGLSTDAVTRPIITDGKGYAYPNGGSTEIAGAKDVFVTPESGASYYFIITGYTNMVDVYYDGVPEAPFGAYFGGTTEMDAFVMTLGLEPDTAFGKPVDPPGYVISVPLPDFGEELTLKVIAYKAGAASEVFAHTFTREITEDGFDSMIVDGKFVSRVRNGSAAEKGCLLYIAIYDKAGMMVYVEAAKAAVLPKSMTVHEFDADISEYPATLYKYRAFCWGEDYVPLFGAIDY